MYVIARDNKVQIRRQVTAGGVFSPWQNVGGGVKRIAAAQNLDGRVFLFGIGTDDALWVCAEKTPGGDWNDWAKLGGALPHGGKPHPGMRLCRETLSIIGNSKEE